jgi:hypothetical protein
MRHARWTATLATLALAGGAAGCGGSDEKRAIPQGTEGAVIFRDSLDDNGSGWLAVPQTPFRGGVYIWNDVPRGNVSSAPGKLLGKRLPPGVSVGVRVEQRQGAALRMIACRESGEDGTTHHAAYQLGVDGRQALIRLWHEKVQPKVLARRALALPNGRAVALDARCLGRSDGAVALTLLVDGKMAVQATDDKPLPNGGVSLQATARGDTDGPPTIAWDDFVVRALRANGEGGET